MVSITYHKLCDICRVEIVRDRSSAILRLGRLGLKLNSGGNRRTMVKTKPVLKRAEPALL